MSIAAKRNYKLCSQFMIFMISGQVTKLHTRLGGERTQRCPRCKGEEGVRMAEALVCLDCLGFCLTVREIGKTSQAANVNDMVYVGNVGCGTGSELFSCLM